MGPEERYGRDPLFRQMVDYLQTFINAAQMTGTEIREAAILAAIHNEQQSERIRHVTGRLIGQERTGTAAADETGAVAAERCAAEVDGQRRH
jgi:hypothetical protein